MEDKEVGRVRKSESTEIVIKVGEYKGEKGVDIREFVTASKYTGFTKSGTKVPIDKWEEFRKIVNNVKLE